MLERQQGDRKKGGGTQLPPRMLEEPHLSAFVFFIKLTLKISSPTEKLQEYYKLSCTHLSPRATTHS